MMSGEGKRRETLTIAVCGVLGIAGILVLSVGIASIRDSTDDSLADLSRVQARQSAHSTRRAASPERLEASDPKGPVPVGNPARWITADDYPVAALHRNEQGKVGVDLQIAATGSVVACRIGESSGHESLDQAACRALRSRARFAPARDANGTPIAATWHRNVVWRLPS
ncbi:TonB family protein [Sphingomonas sp. UYEF23]